MLCRIEAGDVDDQKAGVMMLSRKEDAATQKLGLIANASTVPQGSPIKVLRDLFASNGMTHARDERYVVSYEQRKVEGWKSKGSQGVKTPNNEGRDPQAPKRFSSAVLTNGL